MIQCWITTGWRRNILGPHAVGVKPTIHGNEKGNNHLENDNQGGPYPWTLKGSGHGDIFFDLAFCAKVNHAMDASQCFKMLPIKALQEQILCIIEQSSRVYSLIVIGLGHVPVLLICVLERFAHNHKKNPNCKWFWRKFCSKERHKTDVWSCHVGNFQHWQALCKQSSVQKRIYLCWNFF